MENNELKDCGEYVVGGFHIKKEVNFGHMLSVVLVLFSSIMWIIETKTNNLEQKLSAEDRRIEQKTDLQNSSMLKILGRMERKQDKIFDKLDAKADK